MSQALNEALCAIALAVDRVEHALHEFREDVGQDFERVKQQLDAIKRRESRQDRQIGQIMATLDDLVVEVDATQGAADSVLVILNRLVAELEAANQSGDPAKVDAVLAKVTAIKEKLANAAAANP